MSTFTSPKTFLNTFWRLWYFDELKEATSLDSKEPLEQELFEEKEYI